MIRKYEIVNYANWQIFDLYEINEVHQKYKRFRISRQDLENLLSSQDVETFRRNQLKFCFLNERKTQEACSTIF